MKRLAWLLVGFLVCALIGKLAVCGNVPYARQIDQQLRAPVYHALNWLTGANIQPDAREVR